jgi:glycerophosphoryl diester phosphodiesterase
VRPLSIAHRAGNDLQRLHAAVDAGVDIVEADVHDHRGRLEVRHLKTMGPLPYLWDRWELVPAAAPRLELAEVLQAARPGTLFMLDLKGRGSAVGTAVAAAVHELAPTHDVIVCSRFWPAVEAAAGTLPYVRPVLSARTRLELSRLRVRVRAGAAPYGVSVHRSLLSAPLVAELHESVEVVMTWPINTPTVLEEVLEIGATGVISDELGVLADLMSR